VGRGFNTVVESHDPTAHAEIAAIREACERLGTHDLSGCTLYTSCEPCPMCLGAIYWAGIDRVVYAASRSDAACVGFDDEFLYNEVALPPPERSIQFMPALPVEGRAVLEAWSRNPKRRMY
jgi:tRNA(Arg) A34 adenosine deaminase TadA